MSYKYKFKTINNEYSRKMVLYATSSKFHFLAMVYHNYKNMFEQKALARTISAVRKHTDYEELFSQYRNLSPETRNILNDIYTNELSNQ